MEISNDLVKLFANRLKYPIITVYGIILIIHNWDVLSIFFLSDFPIIKRVNYLNQTYAGQTFWRITIPFLKALAISVIAPAAMLGLDQLLIGVTKKRQNLRHDRIQNEFNNKKDTARIEWEISEAINGKKTIDDWQSKLAEKDKSLEETRTSFQQRIDVMEENHNFQEKLIQQLNEKGIEQRETIEKLTYNLNVENALYNHTNALAKKFIEYIATFLKLNDNTVVHTIDILVKNADNLTLDKLKIKLYDKVIFSDAKYNEMITGLLALNLIDRDDHSKKIVVLDTVFDLDAIMKHATFKRLNRVEFPIIDETHGDPDALNN